MNLESHLADAIVRIDQRLPDVRETLVETLFHLRRERWVESGKLVRTWEHWRNQG